MKHICVVSHHKSGGGKPLDSLWFSQEECKKYNIHLHFLWTRERKDLLKLFRYRYVIFDGVYSLISNYGNDFYKIAQLLRINIALYWHETEVSIDKLLGSKLPQHQVVLQILKKKNLVHFHVCQYGLEMLKRKYEVSEKNLQLLNNISQPSSLMTYKLPLSSEANLFVACGIINYRKGTDLFIDIAEKVITQCKDAKFIWVGPFIESGDFSEEVLISHLQDKGIEKNVIFTGKQEMPSTIIAKASAFLLTSRDDPMPKVLMEALALGKPCVAFGVCGVPELLGEYGTIIPPRDTQAFAQVLIEKRFRSDESQQFARRQWYLQRYTPTAFAIRFAEIVNWWHTKVNSNMF